MNARFNGANLRLVRQCQGYSLNEVGDAVGKSRQYIYRLETGQDTPTTELIQRLTRFLKIEASFLHENASIMLTEDAYHFRKLATTRVTIKQAALAKGELFRRFVNFIDTKLRLPVCDFPSFVGRDTESIERAAEKCRAHWGLGLGPIDNMVRVVENAGAVVTTFHDISREVDALSISARRPIIVINSDKGSACRLRFDIAHEAGHFVIHEAVQTGDRATEAQANRFAGAFLLPRMTFTKVFPPLRGSTLNWAGISKLKLEWKVSKAAILYRARQLDLISESQYKSGIIYGLNRKGEAIVEKEDHLIPHEAPELIHSALRIMKEKLGMNAKVIADQVNMTPALLQHILPDSDVFASEEPPANVIWLPQPRSWHRA